MTKPTVPTDPLDILPPPTEIRRRLGMTYRAARILRGLLRLSERRADHERLSARQAAADPTKGGQAHD